MLAATEHLIITFNGRDERTNQERPPAVPIAELLDAVDRSVRVAEGRLARDRVLVSHPLQSFDSRNFTPGALGIEGPWSFDPLNLEGALALAGPRPEPDPFLGQPLPGCRGEVVRLDALVRFVEHPVRAFLRERLSLYTSDRADEIDDELPIELDGLEKWSVGDRLLRRAWPGRTPQTPWPPSEPAASCHQGSWPTAFSKRSARGSRRWSPPSGLCPAPAPERSRWRSICASPTAGP